MQGVAFANLKHCEFLLLLFLVLALKTKRSSVNSEKIMVIEFQFFFTEIFMNTPTNGGHKVHFK